MSIWEKIFNQFNDEGINYCSWKSNAHLDCSFEGKTDFDLLVAKNENHRINQILYENFFKRRISSANKSYPGMEDFIGMDMDSTKLCHFHIHYQLILGTSGIKNYVIELENALLENTRMHSMYPIKVPPVELELLILMIRLSLKTKKNCKNIIKYFLGRNIYPGNIKNELSYLYQQCNEDKFKLYVYKYTDTPGEFIEAYHFFKETFGLGRFIKIQTSLKKAVKRYQRLGSRKLVYEKISSNLASRNSMSGFASGGICIGFVGCDGSGKSSTVQEIIKWLSWKYSVTYYYMGQPKNDKLARILMKFARGFKKIGMIQWHDDICAHRNLRNAKKRYKNYQSALKDKRQGKIVIYDRFPMAQFWSIEEPMDGPRIPQDHFLSSKERYIYESIKVPDLLFIMKVTAEESIKRKSEHISKSNQIMINNKLKAIDELIEAKLPMTVVIDTVRDQTMVWNDVKRKIWEAN